MKTILVTGANGYLANYVYHENKDEFNWIKMTRKDADFSNPSEVRKFMKNKILIFVFIVQQMLLQLFVKIIPS